MGLVYELRKRRRIEKKELKNRRLPKFEEEELQ